MRPPLAALVLGVALAAFADVSVSGPDVPRRDAPRGFPVRVGLAGDGTTRDLLRRMRVDVDGVYADWARVYVVDEQARKLRRLGLEVRRIPETLAGHAVDAPAAPVASTAGELPPSYHTYETLTADLAAIATDHADITRLFDLGPTVEGRRLWMIKISNSPDVDEDEPEFAYLSSMHGDEVVGKELCMGLIDLLTDGYGQDARVTDLVDGTEIWIMPSMNPDGTASVQRWNANNVDLNRDFPDQHFDPRNSTLGREPETAAVMQWAAGRRINLSANFHGGVLVANYPFDSNPTLDNVHTPTPDQDLFVSLARSYADNNPSMALSNSHPAFDNGITNGADWYVAVGGMQDWNYVWNGGLEVTVELGESKWPAAAALPSYWNENLESLLSYIERVHEGVRGRVTDAQTGEPVAAEVRFDANPFAAYTDPAVGDYHRPLLPGAYDLQVSAVGFEPATLGGVQVVSGPAVRRDVALVPRPTEIQRTASSVLGDSGGDGLLDPGDSADLAVSVTNLGATATSLVGRLEPTGWFGTVARAEAAYPDVAPGGDSGSLAPHHGVALSPDTPAGHKAGFVLRWSADGAAGVSEPFFVDTGTPACVTVPAGGLPRQILDLQTLHHEIDVATSWVILDVEVTVDVTHSYIGDLTLELSSPSGTTVVLHRLGGGASDDIRGTYGDDLVPVGSLSDVAGELSSGAWALEIGDGFPGDSGWLNAWSLRVCGHPVEARPPEMRFRDLRAQAGAVDLTWWPYPGLTSYRVYRSADPASPASFLDVTGEDADPTDTGFVDASAAPVAFYLVTGVGANGESLKGHFGE